MGVSLSLSVSAREKEKREELGITDEDRFKSSQDSAAAEERFQRHLDSASTLNPGSSTGGISTTQSYELQTTEGVSEAPPSTVVEVGSTEEGNSQQVGVACLMHDLLGSYQSIFIVFSLNFDAGRSSSQNTPPFHDLRSTMFG